MPDDARTRQVSEWTARSERVADAIAHRFADFQHRFQGITRGVRERFERRDWPGIHEDTVERLELHGKCVLDACRRVGELVGPLTVGGEAWQGWPTVKERYRDLILGRDDFELAQTFFNSVARKLFPGSGVDTARQFVGGDFPVPYAGWEMASARMYATRRVTASVVRRVLLDAGFRVPFADLGGQCERVAARLDRAVAIAFPDGEIEALDILRPLFIRNKAAYLVGRARRGAELLPVVLVLLHEREGLAVDAVLTSEEDSSVLFSFARWYFHADIAAPREVIGFLSSLMPRKRVAELYITLGYNKHGKTELYNDLMASIRASNERFVVAPGQRGMVMAVFTLPSFEFVFKLIKDSFPPPKNTTREEVRERYRLVLLHDRVGRLVDFQEFEQLTFPRSRFDPELLAELLAVAGETVHLDGDEVVVRHLYVGRRVTPLDLFLADAPPAAAEAALLDFGQAVKDMAAANIFAGDMLLKNFGLTRHARVVFYDYDELCPLTDCTFRRLPPARRPEDEMAAEPWFSVRPSDVFPEELPTFLALPRELRPAFQAAHGDLFDIAFWRRMQQRQLAGDVVDFFRYGEEARLAPPQPVGERL
jgi:isocitrate dehydrogenase kinase/phosphatase